MGVFSILEEESIVPKATDETFRDKLYERHGKTSKAFLKPKISKKGGAHFSVKHYAGIVSFLGKLFVGEHFNFTLSVGPRQTPVCGRISI